MLGCTLLLAFSLLQQPTGAVRIIEFRAPESVPHHPNATVEIFCHTEGDPNWQINGSLVSYGTTSDLEQTRGFTFKSDILHTSPPQYTLNMTVEVAGNNQTNIACVAVGHGVPAAHSRTAIILVAGPPLPPSPILRVVNATDLRLVWEEPFTSEGHGIKQYNISVKTSSNIQAFVTTNRMFDWNRDDIAHNCEELHFTVIATNDVGDSETANISGEFPVAPGLFISPVEYEVTFFPDGQPKLEVCFSPPQICRSQSSSFNIAVQRLDESGDAVTVYTEGPVGYTNGSGAENVTRDIRSGLERNQMYLLTVHFSTVAGDSNSSATFTTGTNPGSPPTIPVNTATGTNPGSPPTIPVNTATGTSDSPTPPTTGGLDLSPDRSNTTSVIGVVVGTLCAVVLLLGIVLIAACTYLRRKAKRKERNDSRLTGSSRGMVPNPLYEGPLYDIINDPTQRKALSKTRAKESCYVDIPPRVFAPRQDRDNKIDRSYENIKLSEKVGTNGAVTSSPSAEDAYTVMKPVGAVKGYATQEQMRSSTDEENRYEVGD